MLFQFSLLCAHRADGSKGQRERWMGRRRRRRRVHACTLYSKPPLALFDPVFINSGKLNGAGGLSSAFSISFGLCPGSGGKFFFSKLHSFPAAAALWCLHMTPGGQSLCLNPLASAGRLFTQHARARTYIFLCVYLLDTYYISRLPLPLEKLNDMCKPSIWADYINELYAAHHP